MTDRVPQGAKSHCNCIIHRKGLQVSTSKITLGAGSRRHPVRPQLVLCTVGPSLISRRRQPRMFLAKLGQQD